MICSPLPPSPIACNSMFTLYLTAFMKYVCMGEGIISYICSKKINFLEPVRPYMFFQGGTNRH